MTQVIKVRWQQRRGTAADLAAKNEVPLDGERIFETDTVRFKTGDGVTHYNDLTYEVAQGGVRNPDGDSYTLTIDDNDYTVISGSSTAFTLILPADADVALPIGAKVAYTQGGAGQLSVVGDSSVTVHAPNGNTTGAQWDGGVAEKIAADEWQLWNGPGLGDMATVDDAPSDGKVYGRKNGAWAEAAGGDGGGITGVNEQTGTTYTLVVGDATKAVRCTNSSAITLTIPKHADVALPLYCVIPILQGGAGAVTITGDGFTPASPNGDATTGTDDFRTLFQRNTDDWVIG